MIEGVIARRRCAPDRRVLCEGRSSERGTVRRVPIVLQRQARRSLAESTRRRPAPFLFPNMNFRTHASYGRNATNLDFARNATAMRMLLVAGGTPRVITGASLMKFAALALASTFALAVGCAQPVFAQTQDQTGAGNQPYAQGQSDTENGNATTGANTDEQNGNWRDDNGDHDGWRRRHEWREGRMGMGPMMRRRHRMIMMNAMGGAHFHFARGKARIDIRCPAEANLQACVHAATELLDKIAELRHGSDNTTGSANQNNDRTNGSALGQEQNAPDSATPNATNPQAPGIPGDRM
jgi:hypothetical protein